MANKDYYAILGVRRDATDEEIKKAFRALAHKHHPDKQGGDAVKFKEINEAYQVLSNKEKRSQYDRFGSDFVGQQGGAGGFSGDVNFDFGDIGDIFGGLGEMFGFGGIGGGRGQVNRGEDVAVDVELTLQEAAFGVDRPLRLHKLSSCDNCGGSGAARGSGLKSCGHCGGRGQVTRVQHTILGSMQSASVCPDCRGSGKIPEKKCPECTGTGVRKRDDQITVKIPGGVNNGETIRIRGRGAAAAHGGEPGDLYVRLHIKEARGLERENENIFSEVVISFPEAVMGCMKETDTLEGRMKVKIPEGTHSGELIRFKGKGAVKLRGSGRGDHFVRIIIDVPKKVSRSARALLEQLGKEL